MRTQRHPLHQAMPEGERQPPALKTYLAMYQGKRIEGRPYVMEELGVENVFSKVEEVEREVPLEYEKWGEG